jgi:hypothetical protein
MIPVHVALVDESSTVGAAALAEVAGALNEQVQRDLAPAWHVRATVGAYPQAPAHTWAIRLRTDISEPGALGYHSDQDRQPFSLVDVDAGEWTVTASHELCEMLCDPFGSRMHGAVSYPDWEGHGSSPRVRYLVEVCDPPERSSYEVGGVAVSDFVLPAFYRSSYLAGSGHYDVLGVLSAPLRVAEGGYISFMDPHTREWWQLFVSGGSREFQNIGRFDSAAFASLREFSDHHARLRRA